VLHYIVSDFFYIDWQSLVNSVETLTICFCWKLKLWFHSHQKHSFGYMKVRISVWTILKACTKCPLHLQYGAVHVDKVSKFLQFCYYLKWGVQIPQCTEFVKTLVVSPGGFSTANMQFRVIKYSVLVENFFKGIILWIVKICKILSHFTIQLKMRLILDSALFLFLNPWVVHLFQMWVVTVCTAGDLFSWEFEHLDKDI